VISPIRSFRRAGLVCWTLAAAVALGAAEAKPRKAAAPAAAQPPRTLRVCLVSAVPEAAPSSAWSGLVDHLRREPRLQCELLTISSAGGGFGAGARLLEADVAVFLLPRVRLDEASLATLRRFFSSPKAWVTLGSTGEAWASWVGFDVDVLGVRSGLVGQDNLGAAERLLFRPHPIWEGVTNATRIGVALTTRRELVRHGETAPGVEVILEGETAQGRAPVAWTRTREGVRGFHLGLGHDDEVSQPGYWRAVRNALFWVTGTPPPADAAVARKSED
jgi:hypothetical protein